MTRLLAATVFFLASSASAVAPSPLGVLRGAGMVSSAHFEYAHATYNVWNLKGTFNGRAVFGNDARTQAQVEQLRTFQLSVSVPRSQLFTAGQVNQLNRAATLLAAECLGVRLDGLDGLLNSALRARAWPAEIRGTFSTVRLDVLDGRYELSVSMDLPAGRAAQCRMPRP